VYKKFSLLKQLPQFVCIALTVLLYFAATPTSNANEEMTWGVTFSPSYTEYLDLDPKEVYESIIQDLGAKHIKLHVDWNAIEQKNDQFYFKDLDHYVWYANQHNVELILVLGMKTGRWPECHTPEWVAEVEPEERQAVIVEHALEIVERYKDSKAVQYWQVENEPYLEFGDCPNWYYDISEELVEAHIAAIRAIDPNRQIIVTESGELSSWRKAASVADIVGITTYRSTWNTAEETFGVNPYTFLSPGFYSSKAAFIENVFQKPVINIELQAEPWTSVHLREATLEEQTLSMNPNLFKENVEFAKQTGLGTYYFWGAEWWYWMKTYHNDPAIWELAKSVFAD